MQDLNRDVEMEEFQVITLILSKLTIQVKCGELWGWERQSMYVLLSHVS